MTTVGSVVPGSVIKIVEQNLSGQNETATYVKISEYSKGGNCLETVNWTICQRHPNTSCEVVGKVGIQSID